MNHVVAALTGFRKVFPPSANGTYPLVDVCQDRKTVHGDVNVFGLDDTTIFCDLGTSSKNRRASFGAENGVDIEVTLATLDTRPTLAIILDPVAESTGMRYRKVNLDRLVKGSRKPCDDISGESTGQEIV